jgi:putative DNA primase/helicase
MTQKIIDEFFAAMSEDGCAPRNISDLVADDKRRYIACALDKQSAKKTIAYQLRIDDQFGVGWFRSFKHGMSAGQTVSFTSKSPRKLTPEQKDEWKKKVATAKKAAAEREEARKGRQKRAASRIKRAIEKLPRAESHTYLEAKKVKPHGLRIRRGELILPIYQPDNLPWSLQRITKDGGKWFFPGGMVEGGYYPLGAAGDDKSLILIAEGFATAATGREETNAIVLCAFNAGNLKKVAINIRSKYPASKIILLADNDRFTRNSKGELWNPGIEAAQQAAVAVGGFIIYPEFPEDDNDPTLKRTDWNDYVNVYGADQLHEKMSRARLASVEAGADGGAESRDVVSGSTAVRSPLTIEGNWRDSLICNKEGNLIKGSIKNIILFLENFKTYKGVFRLNDFQKEIFISRCPPWNSESTFKVRRLDDTDITNCTADMEQYGVAPDTNKVFKALTVASENNKFHPAREYFNALEWDGMPRLETWLTYYLGAEDDDPKYLAFVGKKWLTAAVKRIFEPGCKFDHILVMEGKQGEGKSTALEYMATFEGEAYFTDNIKIADISKDNTIIMLQGSIIVELAELAGFNKKDDEEIKGWIVNKHDKCRRPYDKMVSVFTRQFVLSATTNNYDYLKDPTGNRRYWPLKSSAVDLEAIQRDRKQLWAEAVHWYKSGLYIGPTEEEKILAKTAQNKRLVVDSWEDHVLEATEKLGMRIYEGFRVRDIFRELQMGMRDQDQKSSRRITSILQTNGFENEVKWNGAKSERVWLKKMSVLHNPADEFEESEERNDEQELEF